MPKSKPIDYSAVDWSGLKLGRGFEVRIVCRYEICLVRNKRTVAYWVAPRSGVDNSHQWSFDDVRRDELKRAIFASYQVDKYARLWTDIAESGIRRAAGIAGRATSGRE